MKYVVVISAMVSFANDSVGGAFIPPTKKRVRVKALETSIRDVAFRNGGEMDDMGAASVNHKANVLLQLNPKLTLSPMKGSQYRMTINGVDDWSARVMMEKRVTRKKLELAK